MPHKRRKPNQGQPHKRRRQRAAVVNEGGRKIEIRQSKSKGYDVEMIRDFLDHLLLELRVQLYENQQAVRCLEENTDLAAAMRANEETSPELTKQFVKYVSKYETALIYVDAFDGCDATENEIRSVILAVMKRKSPQRDEQIGHLEALQDLFDEALLCAKLPFGSDVNGNEVRPTQCFKVRDVIDELVDTPQLDELAERFPDHWLLTQEAIEDLKAADAIAATNESFARPLILYGRAKLEEIAKSTEGGQSIPVLTIRVNSAEELQLLVAVIAKHRGRHDYHGTYYDEF